jgi:hypothetical protein
MVSGEMPEEEEKVIGLENNILDWEHDVVESMKNVKDVEKHMKLEMVSDLWQLHFQRILVQSRWKVTNTFNNPTPQNKENMTPLKHHQGMKMYHIYQWLWKYQMTW